MSQRDSDAVVSYPVRTQARALIVHDGKIALIRVRKNSLERWVLPGGGQDAGEALTTTVRRECAEELGIGVEVGALCLVREFIPDNHDLHVMPFKVQCIDFIFRCAPLGSTALHLGSQPDDEAIEARWVDLDTALTLPLYPHALRHWLPIALAAGSIHYLGDAA